MQLNLIHLNNLLFIKIMNWIVMIHIIKINVYDDDYEFNIFS